jgi:hypothetical protein
LGGRAGSGAGTGQRKEYADYNTIYTHRYFPVLDIGRVRQPGWFFHTPGQNAEHFAVFLRYTPHFAVLSGFVVNRPGTG